MDACECIALKDYDEDRVLAALRGIERLKRLVKFFSRYDCSIMITSSSSGVSCCVVKNEDDETARVLYGQSGDADTGRLEHSVDELFERIKENDLAEPRIGEIYDGFH